MNNVVKTSFKDGIALVLMEDKKNNNMFTKELMDGLAAAFSEIEHQHLWEWLKQYFITGGLPEVVSVFAELQDDLYKAFQAVRQKQEELISAYYADIAKHSGKVNAMHIDRVFRSVPAQLEQTHDGSAKKFTFKGVIPGVSHYQRLCGAIDWLIAAGLVFKVSIVSSGYIPLKAHARENIFKLLLFDVGILGMMSGLAPKVILDYNYGSYKGYFAENFVAQEFLCAKKQELFCWSEKTAEVEFLREMDHQVIPVEVKAGKVIRAKSLKVFSEKYNPSYRAIFSGKPLHIGDQTHYYPLYLAGSFPLESSG